MEKDEAAVVGLGAEFKMYILLQKKLFDLPLSLYMYTILLLLFSTPVFIYLLLFTANIRRE